MADLTPDQGEGLPLTMQTLWADMGDGNHARVVGVVTLGLLTGGTVTQWPIDPTGPLQVIDNRLTFTGTSLQVIDGRFMFDDIAGGVKTIATEHDEVHEGETFEVAYMSPHGAEIANDGVIEVLLQVGANLEMHWNVALATGGDAEVEIVRNPTITNAGTALMESNLYDLNANVATVVATHTPTTAAGTVFIGPIFVAAGSGPKAAGDQIRDALERIGALSTNYLIRGTNRSGNAQMMSIHVQWYEEAPA